MPAILSAPRPARYTLALLVATFVLPFLLGTGLYWSGWRPEKFGNHGELIQPPRPMPETGLLQDDGRPLPTADLRGPLAADTAYRRRLRCLLPRKPCSRCVRSIWR